MSELANSKQQIANRDSVIPAQAGIQSNNFKRSEVIVLGRKQTLASLKNAGVRA